MLLFWQDCDLPLPLDIEVSGCAKRLMITPHNRDLPENIRAETQEAEAIQV